MTADECVACCDEAIAKCKAAGDTACEAKCRELKTKCEAQRGPGMRAIDPATLQLLFTLAMQILSMFVKPKPTPTPTP